jgi:hypothetical protein
MARRPRRTIPALSARALPATVTDLMAQRVVNSQPKLIDEVDTVYLALYDDPKFRALRGADDPDQTVEGDPVDDEVCAAGMVRAKGTEMGMSLIKTADLHNIRLKLRGAERRYNASRNKRSKVAAAG